jgi:hypothetical protein
MKLIHRIGYYLGGFSIGLVLLAFFLSGKKTSCDYGPNARTTKNISTKKKQYSDEVKSFMEAHQIDTLLVTQLIRTGDVLFSESATQLEGCKLYSIENTFKNKAIKLKIKNCDTIAIISEIEMH